MFTDVHHVEEEFRQARSCERWSSSGPSIGDTLRSGAYTYYCNATGAKSKVSVGRRHVVIFICFRSELALVSRSLQRLEDLFCLSSVVLMRSRKAPILVVLPSSCVFVLSLWVDVACIDRMYERCRYQLYAIWPCRAWSGGQHLLTRLTRFQHADWDVPRSARIDERHAGDRLEGGGEARGRREDHTRCTTCPAPEFYDCTAKFIPAQPGQHRPAGARIVFIAPRTVEPCIGLVRVRYLSARAGETDGRNNSSPLHTHTVIISVGALFEPCLLQDQHQHH